MLVPFADAIFWIAAACCVVAQGLLLRSALTAPFSRPDAPALPAPRRAVEVAWTLLPAIGLALVLWFSWRAIHDVDSPAGTAPPEASVSQALDS